MYSQYEFFFRGNMYSIPMTEDYQGTIKLANTPTRARRGQRSPSLHNGMAKPAHVVLDAMAGVWSVLPAQLRGVSPPEVTAAYVLFRAHARVRVQVLFTILSPCSSTRGRLRGSDVTDGK